MPNDQISLVLDGDVYIEDLSTAVTAWCEVMRSLTQQVDPSGKIQWALEDVSAGSFFGTLKAVYRTAELPAVEEISRRFTRFGRDIRHGNVGGYSPQMRTAAKSISSVIGDRIRLVRFETEPEDTEIFKEPVPILPEDIPDSAIKKSIAGFAGTARKIERGSYSAIRGRVQSISKGAGLRFTLYESHTDRPVSCYVLPGKEELMREAWGNMAVVEGIVRRDPATGLPMTIRQVDSIRVLPTTNRQGWREAIGCAPARRGEQSPEAAIRRLRDAEE